MPHYNVQGYIDSNGAFFYVLLSPVKIAVLNASPLQNGLYLNRVNVPRGHRRRGIGSALMQEFLTSVRKTTLKHIIVEPGGYEAADQERRVRWCQKHGFVKHEKGYHLLDLTQPKKGIES